MTKILTAILILAAAFAFALHTDVSKAAPIAFDSSERVELDLFINGDPGDVELYVNVGDIAGDNPDLVYFEFRNDSNVYCSIHAIYFDDGTLLGPPTVIDGDGTQFSLWASPGVLPAGDTLVPPFVVTEGFLADSDPPVSHNGVEPGEWLRIAFSLQIDQHFVNTGQNGFETI